MKLSNTTWTILGIIALIIVIIIAVRQYNARTIKNKAIEALRTPQESCELHTGFKWVNGKCTAFTEPTQVQRIIRVINAPNPPNPVHDGGINGMG